MSVGPITWSAAAKLMRSLTYSCIRTIYFSTTELRPPTYNCRFIDETRVRRDPPSILTQDLCTQFRVCRRHKSGKKKSQRMEADEESDDDDYDEDLAEDPNSKVKSIRVASMRLDLIVKSTFGIARNKAEIALYESKIRINGQKVLKKSEQVQVGDEIDLVRGPSPKNPNFLLVSRVTILSAVTSNDTVNIKYTRDKSLLVNEYED